MPESKWGRKETIIWPPRKPIYTLGALFLAVVAPDCSSISGSLSPRRHSKNTTFRST